MIDSSPLLCLDMDDLALATELRSFNRFYTENIGALDDAHEGLDITLGQSRVLFSIAQLIAPQMSTVAQTLKLDTAYASRLIGSMEDRKLVRRVTSTRDRRRRSVTLTAAGRALLDRVEKRSNRRMLALVSHLDTHERAQLLTAMQLIQHLLDPAKEQT